MDVNGKIVAKNSFKKGTRKSSPWVGYLKPAKSSQNGRLRSEESRLPKEFESDNNRVSRLLSIEKSQKIENSESERIRMLCWAE